MDHKEQLAALEKEKEQFTRLLEATDRKVQRKEMTTYEQEFLIRGATRGLDRKKYLELLNTKIKDARDAIDVQKERAPFRHKQLIISSAAIVLVLIIASFIITNSAFTGLFTYTVTNTSTQDINQSFNSGMHTLPIDLGKGVITSLGIDARYSGDFKIFLVNDNATYLVYDTATTHTGLGGITGNVIQENNSGNETSAGLNESMNASILPAASINTTPENISNTTSTLPAENQTGNTTTNSTINSTAIITNASNNTTENTTSNATSNIETGNLTANSTTNSTENSTINATFTPVQNSTNSTEIKTNITTNTTNTPPSQTGEAVPGQEVQAPTKTQQTPVQTPSENNTYTKELLILSNACKETCLVNIKPKKLSLRIEVAQGGSLELQRIQYQQEAAPVSLTQTANISDINLFGSTTLDLSQYFQDENNAGIIYDTSTLQGITVKIEGSKITYTLQEGYSYQDSYDAFIYATNGKTIITSNTFKIYIRPKTETNASLSIPFNNSNTTGLVTTLTPETPQVSANATVNASTALPFIVDKKISEAINANISIKKRIIIKYKDNQVNAPRTQQYLEDLKANVTREAKKNRNDYNITVLEKEKSALVQTAGAKTPAAGNLITGNVVGENPSQVADNVTAAIATIDQKIEQAKFAEKVLNTTIDVKQQTEHVEAVEMNVQDIEVLKADPNIEAVYEDNPVALLATDVSNITRIADAKSSYYSTSGINLTGTGSRICIIDTGITATVVPNYAYGFDVISNNTNPIDDNGHGTAMGRIIYDIAPGSQLIVVKALNSQGVGYESDVIAGLEYCGQQNATIVSLSIGQGQYSGYCDANLVAQTVDGLTGNGTLVVAASGNNASTTGIVAPACARTALAVGASTANDSIAPFTNYDSTLALVAPGTDILTKDTNGGDVAVSGTSASTAIVAGISALIQEGNANFSSGTVAEKQNILIQTGAIIEYAGKQFSRIDAFNALTELYTNYITTSGNATNTTSSGNYTPQVNCGSCSGLSTTDCNLCVCCFYSGSCQLYGSGSLGKNCDVTYSCSGQGIYSMACDGVNGGACNQYDTLIRTCSGTCNNYCINGIGTCRNASAGTATTPDSCTGTTCSTQAIYYKRCDGAGNCNPTYSYTGTTCTGTCNNWCVSGSCTNAPDGTANAGGCTTGYCCSGTCSTAMGIGYGTSCGSTAYGGANDCAGTKTCSGSAATCSSSGARCDYCTTYNGGLDSERWQATCDTTGVCGNGSVSGLCGACRYCVDTGAIISSCTYQTAGTTDTVGLYKCSTCQECDSGGLCTNQAAGSDLASECSGYSCSGQTITKNTCNGAGSCGYYVSTGTTCTGTCASSCKTTYNTCQTISAYKVTDNAGGEVTATSGALACDGDTNYYASANACSYTPRYSECNSGGSCDTTAATYYYSPTTVTVSAGYVATASSGGTSVPTTPVSTSAYCGTGTVCSDGTCVGTTYYRGCVGTSATCKTDNSDNVYLNNIYASTGYTLTGACGTTGTTLCGYSAYYTCSGQTPGRDQYRCDAAHSCASVVGTAYDGITCTGNCSSWCISGSCTNAPQGTTSPCSGYSCSGQTITQNSCTGAGACGYYTSTGTTCTGSTCNQCQPNSGGSCTTPNDGTVCDSSPSCTSETYYTGHSCNAGSCTVQSGATDKDTSQTACTSTATNCIARTWYANQGTNVGSTPQCCGNNGALDSWDTYSGSLTTSTSATCYSCNAGTAMGGGTYYGNGYATADKTTATTLTCYYGDITCAYGGGGNGASGSYCGNGYFSSSNSACSSADKTTVTSGYCYYNDIVCADASAANSAVSPLLYGNGYDATGSGTIRNCYYGDISCADNSYANGTNINIYGWGYTTGNVNADQSLVCYYGAGSCGNGAYSNGTSGTYYGNGYTSGSTCYYGTITCASGSAANGTSCTLLHAQDSCVAGSGCKLGNGIACTVNADCTSNNCRKEIDSASYYCAAGGNSCSEGVAGQNGYATGAVGDGVNSGADWQCTATDTSVQCSASTKCATYNSLYCNGVSTWNAGNGANVAITGCNAYTCGGAGSQVIAQDACNGAGSCVSRQITGLTCTGTCASYCNSGSPSCGSGPSGQQLDCSGAYTCSGQTIQQTLCNGASSCTAQNTATTCTGTCTNYCNAGSPSCGNRAAGSANAFGGTCCSADSNCLNQWFCQVYTGDENAQNNPANDSNSEAGNVQMGATNTCEAAKTFNRGTQAGVSYGFDLNIKYSRTQTYGGDANWWQYSGDSPVTAQIAYTTSDTDLCFVYDYDPCTGTNGSWSYQNGAGTRGSLGVMNQGFGNAVGCTDNWYWIAFGSGSYTGGTTGKNVLGASNGYMGVSGYSSGDYLRQWRFGWIKNPVGAATTSNYWCCGVSTDCVYNAPAQGAGVSGSPDSTTSGCYHTNAYVDTGGGSGTDTEECRSGTWYAQDADQTACTSAGNTWYANLGTNVGNYPQCCGDDSTTDSWATYSGSLASSTSVNCARCNAGAAQGTTTLYGNGYTSGNVNSDTSLTCYSGTITCSGASNLNGTSGTYYGNGYKSGTTCYYGAITCSATPSNGASCTLTNAGDSCVSHVGCVNEPTNLVATTQADKPLNSQLGKIVLTWTDNSNTPNEDGFAIERSPDGSSWSQIGTVGQNVVTYTDDNLADSTPYYYRVRSYVGASYSTYSNTASNTTLDRTGPASTVVTLTPIPTSNSINLSWTKPGDTYSASIYRSASVSGTYTAATSGNTGTTYSDTAATDTAAPNQPSAPSVTPVSTSSVSVSWSGVSDNGVTYYYFGKNYDISGNENNLADNGGFERNFTSWSQPGYASISASQYIEGTQSLYIGYNGGAWAGVSQCKTKGSYTSDRWYRATYRAKCTSGTGTSSIFFGDDINYGIYATSNSISCDGTWQTVDVELFMASSQPTGGHFCIYVYGMGSTAGVYYDNITWVQEENATLTTGVKDYYIAGSGTGGNAYYTSSPQTISGLNCFSGYSYTVAGRDNALNVGTASGASSTVYPISSISCTYGSGAAGYCLTGTTCYYTGSGCPSTTCLTPGTVSGGSCYYDNGGVVDRSNDCTSSGCTGVSGQAAPTSCSAGAWADGAGYCWASGTTNCDYSGTDLCPSGTSGWTYSTASSACTAGTTTCCSGGTYYEGVSCSSSGASNPSYDRDTSSARCTYSGNGCTAYQWNVSAGSDDTACCGDDVSEYVLNRTCSAGACTSSGSDLACCNANTKCVYGGVCYADGYLGNPSGDGTNEKCSSGTWIDAVAPTVGNPVLYSGTYTNSGNSPAYFKGTVSARATISDTGGGGLASNTCQVNINSGGWTSSGVTQDASYCYYNTYAPGATYTIAFRVNDTAGNTGTSSTSTFTYDATPPTTSATGTAPAGGSAYTYGTWTTQASVGTTLSCNDGSGSGCQATQYCTDTSNTCTPGTAYTARVDVSTSGTSYIRYNSTDNLGNAETTVPKTIMIDTGTPTVGGPVLYSGTYTNSGNSPAYFKGTISARATISDSVSGLASSTCQVSINSGAWTSTGVTQDASYCYYNTYAPGATFTIAFRVNDNAGNTGTSSTSTFTYDATPPVTSATAVTNTGASYTFNTWTGSSYVNVTLNCVDTGGVGCSITQYCTDTTNTCTPSTTYSGVVQVSTTGTSYIRYNSTDTLGNVETTNSQTIKIDTSGPSVDPPKLYSGTRTGDTTGAYFKGTVSARANFSDTYNLVLGATCQVNINSGGWTATGVSNDSSYCYYNSYAPGATFTIAFRVNDSVGNTGTSSTSTFNYDATAPVTSATGVKADGSSYTFGVQASTAYVNVTLSCADTGGSGCSVTQYCTDTANTCTPTTTYSAPVQITYQGTSYIRYYSNDSLNNIESTASQTIILNTPPALSNIVLSSTSGLNLTSDNLTVSFTATDAENDAIYNTTDWRRNSVSIAVLNMPFNLNTSSTATGAIADFSTFANNGTLAGGSAQPTWTSSGKVGGAYSFDGVDDYISVANSASLNPTTAITLSAWIKPLSITANTYYEIMRQESGGRKLFSFQNVGTQLTLGLSTGGLYWETDFPITASTFTDGQWHYVVYTYDGSYAKLYIDSALNNSQAHTGAIDAGTSSLYIGSLNGASEFFNGTIDEVQIYNRSLSAQEISAIYTAQNAGKAVTTLASNETASGDQWQVLAIASDTKAYTTGTSNTLTTNTVNCSTPIQANQIYTLSGNIAINGATCFSISAANVTIDCNGYSITGNNTASTYGVYSTAYNTTVKNCNINGFTWATGFNGATSGLIQNSNLSSSAGAAAINYIYGSSNNNQFNNNTVNALGAGGMVGWYIVGGSNNVIDCQGANIIGNNGTGSNGVYSNQVNTTVKNCNIKDFYSAVKFAGATSGTIQNNTIPVSWPGTSAIIYLLGGASDNQVINNTINDTASTSAAIYVSGANTDRNIINGNTITGWSGVWTDGGANTSIDCQGKNVIGRNLTGTYGIYSTQYNTTIKNCNISNFWYAVYLYGATYGSVTNSNLSSTYSNGMGIYVNGGGNHQFINNNATATTYPAIFINNANTNTLTNNIITAASYGLDLFTTINNNITSNNITANAAVGALLLEGYVNNTLFEGNIIDGTSNNAVRFYSTRTNANNIFKNNTFKSTGTLVIYDASGGTNNTFYWNNFTSTSSYYINDASGMTNYYNTSVAGVAQGNYYYNIGSLRIYDTNSDGWGDSGTDYPLSAATWASKWSGGGTDYGPATTLTNTPPTLTAITASPSCIKTGTVTMTTSGAADANSDPLTLYVGSSSGGTDICSSAAGPPERSCTFSVESKWTDTNSHTLYGRVNDGLSNSTERSVAISTDNSGPNAPAQTSPANASYLSSATPTLNWTAPTDVGCNGTIAQYNVTIYSDASCTTPVQSALATSPYYTATTLSDNTYYWNVKAKDGFGNWGSASSCLTFVISTAIPAISFVSPTNDNNSYVPQSYSYVNVSVSGSNLGSALVDWNRSLVGWWRFNSASDFTDYSTYGNTATNSGSTYTTAGKLGGARIVDTSSYLSAAHATSLDISGSFSVGGWVYLTSNPTYAYAPLVQKIGSLGCNAGNPDGFFAGLNTGRNPEWRMMYNGGTACSTYASATALNTNTWYYVMYVFDNARTNVSIYINGVLDSSWAYGPWNNINNTQNVIIGQYINGTIDDITLIKRVLSSQEVSALYAAGSYRLENNFTSLADGAYTYTAYVQDLAGNTNSTETRTVTVDTISPTISFVAPTDANNTKSSRNWTYINATVSDTNLGSSIINFNSSLVGWWRFNYASDFADYSGQGNTATNNGSTYTTAGKFGGARSLDGITQYVSVQHYPNITKPFTLEVWVKLHSTSGWQTFMGRDTDVNISRAAFYLQKENSANIPGTKFTFCLTQSDNTCVGGNSTVQERGVSSTTDVQAETWYHVAATYDGSMIMLYINGVNEANQSYTGDMLPQNSDLLIGASYFNNNIVDYTNGIIDDVQIYNRALSAQEINASYNAGVYRLENNFTSLPAGTYPYQAYVQDLAGNVATTGSQNYIVNGVPVVSNVILSSTSGNNLTTDNLTVSFTATDTDALYNFTDWRKSGTSIAVLNMPFDTNVSSTTTGAVADFSTFANNGTLGGGTAANAPTWTSSGKVGGAYSFDGVNDYIQVVNAPSLNLTSQYAIGFWMKSAGSATYQFIISKSNGGSGGGYEVFLSGTSLRFSSCNLVGNCAGGYFDLVASGTYNDGNWHYVVAEVQTGSTAKIYVDGTKQAESSTVTQDNIANAYDLFIGARGGGSPFNGSIDEVQIYNRSLSAEEISAIYNAQSAGHAVTTLVSNETVKNENWTTLVGSCDGYDCGTAVSNQVTIANSAPTVSNVTITPSPAYTNASLVGYCTGSDVNNDALQYYYQWYLNGATNTSGSLGPYAQGTQINVANISNSSLAVGQNWILSCKVDDGTTNSSWTNSSTTTIQALTPGNVTLIAPTNGNTTVHDRRPVFLWSNTTNANWFEINITSNTGCSADIYTNSTPTGSLNYTPTSDFCVKTDGIGNNWYTWTVRACNNQVCGPWASSWNFTIEPWVIITLTNNAVSFGSMAIGDAPKDTTTGSPTPFTIQNDGNVQADLVNVSASQSFWQSPAGALGTQYFQMKARESNETGSFNTTGSLMSWINVTATNQSIIKQLNYADVTDSAYVDVRIAIPGDEPPGNKQTSLIFSWVQTP